MKNLKILLAACSLVSLTSCASKKLPEPPLIVGCSILLSQTKLVCADNKGGDAPDVALIDADGYTAFSPEDMAKLLGYIADIKKAATGKALTDLVKTEKFLRGLQPEN